MMGRLGRVDTKLQGGSAMDGTLNLFDRLLALGRRHQEMGRHYHAMLLLTRLAGFRELPAAVAEETQVRLAEVHLKRRRFRRARRHLTVALRYQPDSARYHYLMAVAQQANDQGDLDRASEHYRRSLELDPNQVKCLGEYGLLLLRLGRMDEGLTMLRRAVELDADNPESLRRLVKGLRLAGQSDEARTVLRAALFRNPRQPRFRQLWNEFQLQQLRRRARRAEGPRDATAVSGPVLLPFVRLERDPAALAEKVRREAAIVAPPSPRPPRRSDQRNVQ
jgi:Tfp pilus assembly protein PilF